MITVTAAIIEKEGRIFAARRKSGSHLAGCWEFPGGKLEKGETEKECLARELQEEFGVVCEVGDFLRESVYDYGEKIIQLRGYRAHHRHGTYQCRDHDRIHWFLPKELPFLNWAPADIPLVLAVLKDHQISATLIPVQRDSL